MAKSRLGQVIDSIGDMYVVLTILSMQLDVDIQYCVQKAYDEIQDRKGKMLNGIYVKEADLNVCPHGADWDDCPDCRH